jgi:hypothetical protein
MKTILSVGRKRDEGNSKPLLGLAGTWGKKSPMTIGKIGGGADARPTAPKFGVE